MCAVKYSRANNSQWRALRIPHNNHHHKGTQSRKNHMHVAGVCVLPPVYLLVVIKLRALREKEEGLNEMPRVMLTCIDLI
jgi:hypothetical protein